MDSQNPTLQAIYPLKSTLNIMRTRQPSLTPLPNVTGFGDPNTIYAQLFYDGVEQFYCHADSCTQDVNDSDGSASWHCNNLHCTCRPNTTFCGGVPASDLTSPINGLVDTLDIDCAAVDPSNHSASCTFKQETLVSLFGADGLPLNGCTFGECVQQSVINNGGNLTDPSSSGSTNSGPELSGGVIAGLAVVGGLVLLALLTLLWGLWVQRRARLSGMKDIDRRRVPIEWLDLTYIVPASHSPSFGWFNKGSGDNGDKTILNALSGRVNPGQMMAILGPSGAGKTTLVEILAGKSKSGVTTGQVLTPAGNDLQGTPRIGFVPQQDILPPMLTVYEALIFAARLKLPESIPDTEKSERVNALLEKLGIEKIKDTRIGTSSGEKARGISGGEMRRVSIGMELIAAPDVLILDEPTSGLDSVSAARVANLLRDIAHDPVNPIPVIASIHQPSSQLYQQFDTILVLSQGHALYSGAGSMAPVHHFRANAASGVATYREGYNVADYLLEVASDPPVGLFDLSNHRVRGSGSDADPTEKVHEGANKESTEAPPAYSNGSAGYHTNTRPRLTYATTFLTQFRYLCGREWKILRRDKSLFITHLAVSCVLGVFCGGLYYQTNESIAGFQSRVGCLFFLGALIAFSSLSALYNIVEIRPLFLRERSSAYYSPTSWLLSRFFFDMIPLRLIPTIIVSSVTYWMAGLSHHPANFFKFLFVLVLYSMAMTLFNFLLGTLFQNGGIAILLSALTALYQMTYAGFFVHLDSIPPVLRWLQWLCPLKYTLEALSVNEVGSGLMIKDTLEGVPVNVSASLIMNLLFGFGDNNYYRDILVLFAFIAGFGLAVIAIVWFKGLTSPNAHYHYRTPLGALSARFRLRNPESEPQGKCGSEAKVLACEVNTSKYDVTEASTLPADMRPTISTRLKAFLLSCLITASLPLPGAAIWPFPKKRFSGSSLVDAGTLGLTGNKRVVAFGDFSGDQFLDFLSLDSDQRTFTVHYWDHEHFAFQEGQYFTHPTKVVNVVPGDFTHTGKLDLLVMSQGGNKDQLDMYVYPSIPNNGFDTAHPVKIQSSTAAQPIPLDVDGDMKIDLLGLTSSGQSQIQVWQNVWNSSMPGSPLFELQDSHFQGSQCRIANPHSNAVVDLNGDCLADVFLVCDEGNGEKSYQIWLNKKSQGFLMAARGSFPSGTQSVSFGDIDRDGTMDMVFTSCRSVDSKGVGSDCYINIAYNQQLPLCASTTDSAVRDGTRFRPLPYLLPLPKRVASRHRYLLRSTHPPLSSTRRCQPHDGFPDFLTIIASGNDRSPYLVYSVPCGSGVAGCRSDGNGRRGWKVAEAGTVPLANVKDARGVTFLDMDEDGSLDIMIQRTGSQGGSQVSFVQNNFYYDAFFLKAIVLNGACNNGWCYSANGSEKYLPFGVSYSGASFKYTVFDPAGHRSAAQVGQLSQTSYHALQTPYSFFGLGRTNNYIENLFVGTTIHAPEHYLNMEGVIPNSRVVIFPPPPNSSDGWKRQLFLRPGNWIPWVTVTCVAGMVVLAIIIFVLHLNEKREDELERRRASHHINFDAL
ncbi:hypothetical protein NP233_g4613 [Leucocoprinus birnbaumii]|uniref:ABC transporter domain-containing protein n=1 Tax=Leucocoprinus birnbaumii TaxID=56174 RepID=A0AAD5YVC3_9AGAR|nr:hypothetical protein NP233_g4613 [Leucocoprinus birnbaumii]